jgi:hypothetical protein
MKAYARGDPGHRDPALERSAPGTVLFTLRPARRGRRARMARPAGPPQIPIVDSGHAVLGWTDAAPVVEQGRLRHPDAERILGGPIFCTQVALTQDDDIRRAGGPAAWNGAWRCLALCRLEHARGFGDPKDAPPIGSAPGDDDNDERRATRD